jgi:hypothetical protein
MACLFSKRSETGLCCAVAAELSSAERRELFDAKLSLVFVTFVLTMGGSILPWMIRRLRRSLELICESSTSSPSQNETKLTLAVNL